MSPHRSPWLIALIAALGRATPPTTKRSQRKHDALVSCGLRLPERLNDHGSDAIVCASTAKAVAHGGAIFSGEPAERRYGYYVGGGIAIPSRCTF